MSWPMVYVTLAVATLSVAGAWCCTKSSGRDSRHVIAVVAAAALWPVVVVGAAQFGVIALYARLLRRHAPAAAQPPGGSPGELSRVS